MPKCIKIERDWLCTAAFLTLGGFATILGGCGTGGTSVPIAPTLSFIAVTPANGSVAQGMTQQFKATGTYSDNSTQDLTATVTWSSSATERGYDQRHRPREWCGFWHDHNQGRRPQLDQRFDQFYNYGVCTFAILSTCCSDFPGEPHARQFVSRSARCRHRQQRDRFDWPDDTSCTYVVGHQLRPQSQPRELCSNVRWRENGRSRQDYYSLCTEGIRLSACQCAVQIRKSLGSATLFPTGRAICIWRSHVPNQPGAELSGASVYCLGNLGGHSH